MQIKSIGIDLVCDNAVLQGHGTLIFINDAVTIVADRAVPNRYCTGGNINTAADSICCDGAVVDR